MWLNPMAPLVRSWSSAIDDQKLPDGGVLAAGAGWAVFFFVVGLEIKRELVLGDLRDRLVRLGVVADDQDRLGALVLAGRVPRGLEVLAGLARVAINTDVEQAVRQASEGDWSVPEEMALLAIHGCLHLLGHDHQVAADAAHMERLEGGILEQLGIADPYAGPAGQRPALAAAGMAAVAVMFAWRRVLRTAPASAIGAAS